MRELAELEEIVGRAGSYATCASRPTPPTPPAARCCSASQEQAHRDRDELLFFELEWAALDDERAEELLADRRARLLPPLPARRRAATARTC